MSNSDLVSKRCENCGLTKDIKYFAIAKFNKTGYEIWCKDCRTKNITTAELFKDYLKMNNVEFNKFNWDSSFEWAKSRELRKYPNGKDLPGNFNELVIQKAIGKYQAQSNITGDFEQNQISSRAKNNKSKTKDAPKGKIVKRPKSNFEITDDMLERWGYELELEDYEYMEKVYKSLTDTYKSDTPIQRMLYEDISRTRCEANKALRDGNLSLYEKLVKMISTLMNDANIKPVQETAADNEGLGTWGQWVKKIEEDEPIPEPRDEFKDVDGIGRYINEWFVGHFSRMFGMEFGDSKSVTEVLSENKDIYNDHIDNENEVVNNAEK